MTTADKYLIQKNQFIIPSYQHYGGYSGFQTYGVEGVKIKNKILELWRKFFIDNENIVEISTPSIMPYDILKASGHVDRFTDYIVTDKDGIIHRADHLVKDYFNKNNMDVAGIDGWDDKKLTAVINKYNMLSQTEKVDVECKNLMYDISSNSIHTKTCDYLRPELAQGIFVNFDIIRQYLKKEPPFGIANIGRSYRKEISPKQFLRMREFTQAEIEFFVHPKNKTHQDYDKIKDYMIPILTANMQPKGEKQVLIKIKDARANKMISNNAIAYFLARVHMFGLMIGLDPKQTRFRQHLPQEMAHYASECWDLETLIDGEWLECVGLADRGDYDLRAHSKKSNIKLMAKAKLDKPSTEKIVKVKLNKKLIGKTFKQLTPKIINCLEKIPAEYKHRMNNLSVKIDDNVYTITNEMIDFEEYDEIKMYEKYYPHVIEPSFGIDRLIYSILKHNYWVRKDDTRRSVLSLPYQLTPYHVAIFQLFNKPKMIKLAEKIKNILKENGYICYIDNSGTAIGKRYVRADELGIKFAITVDPGSLKDNMVTIRDRDSMKQNRINIEKLKDTNFILYHIS